MSKITPETSGRRNNAYVHLSEIIRGYGTVGISEFKLASELGWTARGLEDRLAYLVSRGNIRKHKEKNWYYHNIDYRIPMAEYKENKGSGASGEYLFIKPNPDAERISVTVGGGGGAGGGLPGNLSNYEVIYWEDAGLAPQRVSMPQINLPENKGYVPEPPLIESLGNKLLAAFGYRLERI